MILFDRKRGALGAYMNADTAPKVGFRPYLETDAFGAAHLSGYGLGAGDEKVPLRWIDEDVMHPFMPNAWHLHGLGVYHLNRPFDPWELYPDVHQTAGLHGWQLGDGAGNAGDDAAVMQAIEELQSSGLISASQADSLTSGAVGFKDVLGYDPTDQAHWMDLVGSFRSANQSLVDLEQAYAKAGPQPGNMAWAQFGRDLNAKRSEYSDLASQFIRYYTLVMGNAPSGLSGLGIAPIILVAGAIVFIVSATIAIYALHDWSKSIDVNAIKAQTAQVDASTEKIFADQMAAAQARGDTVTANTLAAQIAKMRADRGAAGGQPGDLSSWFMSNAKWIGLGAAGLIVLGPLSQNLFGRRR